MTPIELHHKRMFDYRQSLIAEQQKTSYMHNRMHWEMLEAQIKAASFGINDAQQSLPAEREAIESAFEAGEKNAMDNMNCLANFYLTAQQYFNETFKRKSHD